MTDEERQRQMDFIVSTLASLSAKLYTVGEKVDGLATAQTQAEQERKASEQERKASELERKADAVRISRLEEAFVSLSKLSERMVGLLGDHQSRITNVEEAIAILTRLLNRGNNRTRES
jgi:hypothetical protein